MNKQFLTILIVAIALFPINLSAATDTFFASSDGWAACDASATWATCRNDTSVSSFNDSSTNLNIQTFSISSSYTIRRSFLEFDTSSLPDNAVISSVTISLYATGAATSEDNDGRDYAVAVESTDTDSGVDGDDFDNVGSVAFSDTKDYSSDITGAGYVVFTLNANGIAAISKTGTSKFAFREGHDMENDPISGDGTENNSFGPSTIEVAGTTQDPKIEITYSIPPSPVPPIIIWMQ